MTIDWDELKKISAGIKHKTIIAHKPDYSTSIMTGYSQGIEPVRTNNSNYLSEKDKQERLEREKLMAEFRSKLEAKLPMKKIKGNNKLKI
jgi:hypothetical protein